MLDHITREIIEDKAENDGLFAIAAAILDLADAQGATARALRDLGNADAGTPMGAIEAFGVVVSEGLEGLALAIGDLAEATREGD
jgi:hypothetical protein